MKPTRISTLLAAVIPFAMSACQTYTDIHSAGPPLAPSVYNVKAFGATGDGHAIDSRAINAAITAAASAGGGTVFLPAGHYLCGSIHMQSNIDLHLDIGAHILGLPADSKEFDPPEPFPYTAFQDGGHTFFHNSLIWGENLHNVAITGFGTIDGGGITSRDKAVNEGSIAIADKAIALKLCTNVLIRDVTLFHGGHFAIITTGVDLLTIDNVTIDTNRDGIDIDCCRNVTVSNCRVNSPRDDAIVPKSSFALNKVWTTENLTITNCQVSGFVEGTLLDGTMKPSPLNAAGERQSTGRIKFGTEANGGFRNVTVSNCTFRHCRGFALEEVDGAVLENFTVTNLTMTDISSYAIYITTGERNRGPNITTTSALRNVSISHVIATGVDATSGIQITGLPDHPLENIRLDDIQIISTGGGTREQADRVPPELLKTYPEPQFIGVMPAYGLFARHVKNLEISNARFSFEKDDQRPAIALADINGLDLDNIKAQLSNGITPARFEAVTGYTIRNSPILEAPNAITKSDTARQGIPATRPAPPPQDQGRQSTQPFHGDDRPDLPWLRVPAK